MPTQLGDFLRSYDFFAKSIPGLVFLAGMIPLLNNIPEPPGINSGQGISFTFLVLLILAMIFIGLVFGQVIHTIAVNIEKILYWGGHILDNLYYEYLSDRLRPYFSNDSCVGSLLDCLKLKQLWKITCPWVSRRYWGIQDIFKSHRRLFENSLGWHFDKEAKKQRGAEDNLVYHGFKAAFGNNFDIGPYNNLSEFGIDSPKYLEFRQLYPLIASEVSRRTGGRATTFQSIYSFCRGMWVVLLANTCVSTRAR